MSGVLTAAEIGAQVRINLGNRTTTDVPDTRVIVWMNWALDHLASPQIYRHRELQVTSTGTLVTSTAAYNTKGGSTPETLDVVAVVISNPSDVTQRYRLTKIRDRDGFESLGAMTDGLPTWYELWGSTQLNLLPAPSSTYNGWTLSVRRIQRPTYFTLNASALQSSETSPFAREWDEAVVMGASWRGFRALQQLERAKEARAEYGLLINEIAERLKVEAEDVDYGPPLSVQDSMP